VARIVVSLTLPLPDGTDAPSAFRIWPWGETQTLKGRLVLDERAAETVMKAFGAHGIELAIDYEHQTFASEKNGAPAPAAGWFTPEVREDGLWAGNVRWTDKAAAMLKAREYRYFSPTVELDAKTRRPVRLMPMALTNWPATQAIAPLVARADEPKRETFMEELLEALGLKTTAELLSAFKAMLAFERDVFTFAGAKSTAEAFGILNAYKTRAELTETLADELATLKASVAAGETKTLLDEAVKDGRVEPARRAELEELQAKHGTDALRTMLRCLRKAPAEAREPKKDPDATIAAFGAEQVALIKKIGADPAAVAKHKAQTLAARANAPTSEEG